MRFHGLIEKERLVFPEYSFRMRLAYLAKFKEGTKVTETINKEYLPKSLEQLAYYFVAVLPTVHKQLVADGHEVYGVPISEDMTDKILKEKCARFDGKVVNKADMSLEQASTFITNCINWANEMLNCQIPPPMRFENEKL